MNQMQKEVHKWIELHDYGYWKPLEILSRIVEEVGELSKELNHRYGAKKKKAAEKDSSIGDEIGDVLFSLICLANREGLDLDRCFTSAMCKCYGRDKNRFAKKTKPQSK